VTEHRSGSELRKKENCIQLRLSMTLSQSSVFSCNTPPLNDTIPALFTRILTHCQGSLSTRFSAGSNPARSVTSTLIASEGAPIVFSSESTCWFFSLFSSEHCDGGPGFGQSERNACGQFHPLPPSHREQPGRLGQMRLHFIKYPYRLYVEVARPPL